MTEQLAAQWLAERDNVLLLTHVRPDGDTLGSAGGLILALRELGKTAYLALNDGVTGTYVGFLPENCFAPADFVPEHIVAVDIATENLFPDTMEQWKGKVELCIDHHPSNEFYAGETCLDATAAACGEIIYRICGYLGVMNAGIAEQLYLAISTDCGCFVYNSTTPETHRIAAELIAQGDFWKVINKTCFQTVSHKELQLQSMLVESMDWYDDGATVIGAISQADMERIHATKEDSEELASFANKIEGVKVAATLRQLGERVWKLSLRTDGSLNATRACALLGGGGHAAAAGATMNDVDEKQARERVLSAIRTIQDEG